MLSDNAKAKPQYADITSQKKLLQKRVVSIN